MKILFNCILVGVLFSHSKAIAPPMENKIVTKKTNVEIVLEEKKEIYSELHILHPAFRNKVIMMIYECKKQGIELKVVETYRTHERQDKLKRKKLSMLSGGCSKHQHFIAVDVVPVVKGIPRWFDDRLWKKIGIIGKKQGLRWGGDWRKFRDWGHFEYPISIKEVQSLEVPDTVIIPLNY